ncbi:hypothetical protein O9Z70_13300 [Devosia sp. YIM 151766]|uniref:hypothetical protein n=1 Tax=Devosia sp. YIM 151766 TaxID=3017325 RepID=UPI00255C9416|nr:hypothetical protein [Devosia sp. YIM 151766]WIY52426.1 hypothetical protein O9Z70_13300 [Devosia sp. YIM 151766]
MFELGVSSDSPQHLSCRSLPLRILAMVIVATGLAGTTPALANPNNPTRIEDCNAETAQFSSRLSSVREQLHICIMRRVPGEPWGPVSQCGRSNAQSCLPLDNQLCELEAQKRLARDACVARVRLHQQEEAEERRRQADEKRAEAARQREAAELERAQGNPMAAAIDVQIGAVAGGLGAAAAGGIPVGLPIGALHLSNEFSAIGGAAANRIRMDSLNQLENALNAALGMSTEGAGPNASSPYDRRPTQAQIAYELNAPLDQAERAAALQVHLPFGGESAVVGANAQYLTDLAYARANGTLTTPLSQTQIQSAISAGSVTGGQGASLAIIEDEEPLRQASEYEDGLLQQQRLASLGEVQARLESERLAEAERQWAMQVQQQIWESQNVYSAQSSSGGELSKPDCVEVEELSHHPGKIHVRNHCDYDVSLNNTNIPVINNGFEYTCDRDTYIGFAHPSSQYPTFNQIIRDCLRDITRK